MKHVLIMMWLVLCLISYTLWKFYKYFDDIVETFDVMQRLLDTLRKNNNDFICRLEELESKQGSPFMIQHRDTYTYVHDRLIRFYRRRNNLPVPRSKFYNYPVVLFGKGATMKQFYPIMETLASQRKIKIIYGDGGYHDTYVPLVDLEGKELVRSK